MSQQAPSSIALFSAAGFDGASVPEWVHLVPVADGRIDTVDARGPYRMADVQAVIQSSMTDARGLPIDENHATDLAAPKGLPAPARGWIVELQARADGIWGRVEWTDEGRALVAGRAYRGLSPVLGLGPDKRSVLALLRASLVNTPNMRGLAALNNQEKSMTFMERLADALGLPATASEDDVLAAVRGKKSGGDTALQSSLTAIGTALGVAAEEAAIVAAARALKTAQPAEVVALQSQLAEVTTQLNTLTTNAARERAEAVVDEAIRKGRVGVKPSRDRFIALHMADPAATVAMLDGLPVLQGALPTPPAQNEGGPVVSLNAEQATAAKLLGIAAPDYLKSLNADRKETV